jgi:MFS family permease
MVTVLLGAFLSMADFFIVNVALPTIGETLHASGGTLELVVAGYGLAYALLLVLGGRLGDAFGRRRLFLTGMALFTVTSLACGLAPSVAGLVVARIAQGASAALMVPQVLATIQATTAGARRARAIGLYGVTGGIAAAVGQLAGGALVSADLVGTTWRPIFLVNVPIGLLGLALAVRLVPATRSTDPTRVDLPGTALLGAAVLTLLVPLMEGRSLGWPVWTWVLLALFPVVAVAFVRVERRVELAGGVPLVPLSLLRLPSVRRGLALGVLFFTGFGGFMFVFAVALQQGIHLSALASGLALLPMALGFLATSVSSARLVARYGRRVPGAGALIQAVGLLTVVVTALLDWPRLGAVDLLPGMAIAGVGQGMVMSPLIGIVLSDVPASRAGVGSGVFVTTQQTALALGVATLGSLFLSLGTGAMGVRGAFVTVLLVQATIAVVFAVLSRGLPDGRR